MADFVAVLRKTLDGMGDPAPETRQRVYERARVTVMSKLQAISPPPPKAVADRQIKALEDAIVTIESSYAPPPKKLDPLDELEDVFASLNGLKDRATIPPPRPVAPTVAKPSLATPSLATPKPAIPATRPAATAVPVPAAVSPSDEKPAAAPMRSEPSFAPSNVRDEIEEDIADEPVLDETRPDDGLDEAPRRRGYGGAIAAVLILAALAGGGYGVWLNKDDFSRLVGLTPPADAPTTPVQTEPSPAPADVAAAPAEPEPEPSAPEPEPAALASTPATPAATPVKLTQKLNEDGSEVDPGPAGGAPSLGEGTSVAEVTQPSTPEPTPPVESAPAADAKPPALPPVSTEGPATPPADAAQATAPSTEPPAPAAGVATPPPSDTATPPADTAAAETPPTNTPPADTAPVETPPADTAAAETPPVAAPPATPKSADAAATPPVDTAAVAETTPPAASPAAPADTAAAETPASVPPPATSTEPAPAAGTTTAAVQPPADAALAVGQKAIFYEERTSSAQGSAEPGSTVWSVVRESPGGDRPAEPAIHAEATIPGKDVQLRLTIRRNADPTLPASHIVEMIFLTPEGFEGGGVDNVLRMAMKSSEQDAGNPIIGIPAKIADGFFLIALNDNKAEIDANMNLLLRQSWIDIPIVYKSGRRALITMEKGIPGEKVFDETLKAWGVAGSG